MARVRCELGLLRSLPNPQTLHVLASQRALGALQERDHDEPDAFSGQNYFPEEMGRKRYYEPVERGFERELRKRLDYWDKLRRDRQKDGG